MTCGGGVRQRLVKCVNLAGKMLNHSKCDSFRKPAETVACGVPCVKWVAGEWGQVRELDHSIYSFRSFFSKKENSICSQFIKF